uniref:Poly [ADP-ribose] polymerase n=1 Tax=Saccoglossus kowalevskii TaxID=10224 RepID=A0ABM0M7L7_SACKO|nr:PREDICTED: poly [ADP-ribose] polymerase 14-like [Saccoglossus kowalevskii]
MTKAIWRVQLQQEINGEKMSGVPTKEGCVIVTSGGNMQCNNIYHVLCCEWDSNGSKASQAFEAEIRKLAKVSLRRRHGHGSSGGRAGHGSPLMQHRKNERYIHSGYHQHLQGASGHNLEKSLFMQFKQKSRRNGECQMMIGKILVQLQEGDITNDTTEAIVNSSNPDLDLRFGAIKSLVGGSDNSTRVKIDTIILHIYADSQDVIKDAVTKIDKLMESESIDTTIVKDTVKRLTNEDMAEIYMVAEPLQVKVELVSTGRVGHLRIQGITQSVMEVQSAVNVILDRISAEEGRKRERMLLAKNVRWLFRNWIGDFEEYDDEICGMIEQARNSGNSQVDFKMEGGTYRIVFSEMIEKDLDDLSSTVEVKRELKEGGVPLPANWTTVADNESMKVEDIPVTSTEYQTVETRFKASLGGTYSNVIKIERVQNPRLYRQYAILKQNMDAKNPAGTINEKILYHGTSGDSVVKINHGGFNRSFCATMYGAGSYFALKSEYSARDTYSPVDPSGQKHVYQCKVLTGVFTVGCQGLLVPPSRSPNDPTDCYDRANGALTDQKKKLISFGDEFTVQLKVSACPLEMEARYLETYATEEADDVSTCNVQTDSLLQTRYDNSNLPLKGRTLEPSLNVQPENKDSSSKIEISEDLNCTIEVTGFNPDTSAETIELYFENTRRSGGGVVTECRRRGNKFIVTFENQDAVRRVLEQPTHVVKHKTLLVQKAEPDKPEMNTVKEIVDVLDDKTNCTIEVTGCDPDTSPETIELYFDNKRRSGGGDVSECRQEGDKFFVTFENEDVVRCVLEQPTHVVKNTTLLVKQAAKTDIKTVENVEEIVVVLDDETNCTIEVTGCDPGTSPETIELYFDNKRRSPN